MFKLHIQVIFSWLRIKIYNLLLLKLITNLKPIKCWKMPFIDWIIKLSNPGYCNVGFNFKYGFHKTLITIRAYV